MEGRSRKILDKVHEEPFCALNSVLSENPNLPPPAALPDQEPDSAKICGAKVIAAS